MALNWPHIHLALNHIPVLGSVFLLLLLATGLLRRSTEIQRVSLWGVVALTLLTVPIKFTGDAAHTAVKGWPGVDDRVVERHEQMADRATTAIFLAGVVAAAGLMAARAQRPLPRWATLGTLALLVTTSVLMARAAGSGGHIRHPETEHGLFFRKASDS